MCIQYSVLLQVLYGKNTNTERNHKAKMTIMYILSIFKLDHLFGSDIQMA